MSNCSRCPCLYGNRHAGKLIPVFLSHNGSQKCCGATGGADGSMMMCDRELRPLQLDIFFWLTTRKRYQCAQSESTWMKGRLMGSAGFPQVLEILADA